MLVTSKQFILQGVCVGSAGGFDIKNVCLICNSVRVLIPIIYMLLPAAVPPWF